MNVLLVSSHTMVFIEVEIRVVHYALLIITSQTEDLLIVCGVPEQQHILIQVAYRQSMIVLMQVGMRP